MDASRHATYATFRPANVPTDVNDRIRKRSSPCPTSSTTARIVVGTGFRRRRHRLPARASRASRFAFSSVVDDTISRRSRPCQRTVKTLPDARRWTWGGSQGLWDLRNLDGVTVLHNLRARYGGGSLIYANVHLRPPEEVFNADVAIGLPGAAGGRASTVSSTLSATCWTSALSPRDGARRTARFRVMYEAFRNTARGVAPGSSRRPPAAPAQPQDVNVFFPPLAIRFPEDDEAL